ncbi:MAG: hypothetical protein AB1758_16990, partial [Candidatus Eremiobacterota bacterium]
MPLPGNLSNSVSPYQIARYNPEDLSESWVVTLDPDTQGMPVCSPFEYAGKLWCPAVRLNGSATLYMLELDPPDANPSVSSYEVAFNIPDPAFDPKNGPFPWYNFLGDPFFPEAVSWGFLDTPSGHLHDVLHFPDQGLIVPKIPHANQLLAWDLSTQSVAWSKLGWSDYPTKYTVYTPLIGIGDKLIVHWEEYTYTDYPVQEGLDLGEFTEYGFENDGAHSDTLAVIRAHTDELDSLFNSASVVEINPGERLLASIHHGFWTVDVATGTILSTLQVSEEQTDVTNDFLTTLTGRDIQTYHQDVNEDPPNVTDLGWSSRELTDLDPQDPDFTYGFKFPAFLLPGSENYTVDYTVRTATNSTSTGTLSSDLWTRFDLSNCATDGTNIYFLPRGVTSPAIGCFIPDEFPPEKQVLAFDPETWDQLWMAEFASLEGLNLEVSNGIVHNKKLLFMMGEVGQSPQLYVLNTEDGDLLDVWSDPVTADFQAERITDDLMMAGDHLVWNELAGKGVNVSSRLHEIPAVPVPFDENDRNACRWPCPPHTVNWSGVAKLGGALMAYSANLAASGPGSPGYGWTSPFYARIEELANGDLKFHDGTGMFDRWVKTGDEYVPAHRDNYTQAVKNQDDTYTLTFQDSSTADFDDQGRITSLKDRNDNETTCTYDSQTGRLTEVTDWRGRTLYFTHGTDGQPTSIRQEDPVNGRQIRFEYFTSGPNQGRLQYQYNAENEVTEFAYFDGGKLKQVIDPRGNVAIEYTYYTAGAHAGKVETETFYGERSHTYTYDDQAGTVTVVMEDLTGLTNPATRTQVHHVDLFKNVVKYVDALENEYLYEYNDPFNPYQLTRSLDPNLSETVYTYNEQGMRTSVLDSQGNLTRFEYADDIDEAPISPYHRNLLRKIHRAPVTVPGEQDPVQYAPTEFLYDDRGNLLEIRDARFGITDKSIQFDYGTRTDGLVVAITDRRGNTTSFTYDAYKNLETVVTPDDGPDNPSRTTTFEYDDYDRLVKLIDPLGNEWETQFDDVDRPTTVTDARGMFTTFSYLDGLLDEVELPANQGSDTDRRKTNYVYDEPGRVEQILSDIGPSSQQMRVKFLHDGFSNLRKLIRLRDAAEKFTAYDYDVLDRTTRVQDPMHTPQNPRETTISHAPFCTQFTVTTARGVQRQSKFDTMCRLTEANSSDEKQLFEYDELHRLVKLTQAPQPPESRYGPTATNEGIYGTGRYGGGTPHVRTFEYDELDRLVKMTFEDGGTLLYDYDDESNLTKLTDTEGNVTEYAYYKDGRLRTVTLKRSGQSDRVFTYRYDEAGRLKTLTYPSSTGIVANFGYGGNWVHGWNQNGQLTYLEYKRSGALLHRFEYAYDDSGNRISLIDTPQDASRKVLWSYGYDWLNRLNEVIREMPDASPAVPKVTTYYAFDESDNRIEFGYTEGEVGVDPTIVTEYTYNDADELLERTVD